MSNSFNDSIQAHFERSIATKQVARRQLSAKIAQAATLLISALRAGNKILTCGNGGSACDAMHLSSELLNRYHRNRASLAAVSLVADQPTLSSIANDYAYEQVFARQIEGLGQAGDILVCFTTSGNSSNLLPAVNIAHEKKLSVLILSGRDGGRLAKLLNADDVEIRVPADETARIQETHLLIIHCLCDLIDQTLFPESS